MAQCFRFTYDGKCHCELPVAGKSGSQPAQGDRFPVRLAGLLPDLPSPAELLGSFVQPACIKKDPAQFFVSQAFAIPIAFSIQEGEKAQRPLETDFSFS